MSSNYYNKNKNISNGTKKKDGWMTAYRDWIVTSYMVETDVAT
jgi:hypothetical protein